MVFDRLVRTFATVGLAAGVAGAAIWHWARQDIGGFTVFGGTSNEPIKMPTHHPDWWPYSLIFLLAGLALGAATGLALVRFGWTMTRTARAQS